MRLVVFSVILGIASAVLPPQDFLGTSTCPQDVCHYQRGHFGIKSSPKPPEGRDFRTFHITKDYATQFDITFIIKNIENLDLDFTRLNIGVQNQAMTNYYYASITSSKDKIFHFYGVTNARIAFLSFQENVALDIFYFMDCGFKMDQSASVSYPEVPVYPAPVLKMWNPFVPIDGEPLHNFEKTCWFVIPRDNYKGWANIEKTYIIMGNASLGQGASLHVANALTGENLLTQSELYHSDGVATVEGQPLDQAVSVGANDFPVTTVLFVDLACSNPWDSSCKHHTKFSIIFKPLTKQDTDCIQVENYCRYGTGVVPPNFICKPEDRLPKNPLGLYRPEQFTTSRCPGMKDLLQAITFVMMSKTEQDTESPMEQRMGMMGKCSRYNRGCPSSIRTCSHAGSCKWVCFLVYIQRGCRARWKYSYSYG